jgi:hypothetical protein
MAAMAKWQTRTGEHAAGATAKRRGRAVAVGAAATPLIEPTLRRRGFVETRITRDWAAIVGDALAAETMPIRLVFPKGERLDATLLVRVTGPLALELQHLAPLVIEKINGHFGYRAVARLSLRQGPRGPVLPPRRPPMVELTAEEERQLADRVACVADPALRQSLFGLGRVMQGSRRGRTQSSDKRAR